MPKLTKVVVEAAEARDKQYSLWCSELPGFGVYIQPTGNRTYFVDYRNAAGVRRRLTIGRHGKITAEQARKLAIVNMGDAVMGEDPADERTARKKSITMKELCERYLEAAEKGQIMGKKGRPKKESTLYVDRGRIARHIVPLLGTKKVRDLGSTDINRFLRDIIGGKTAVTVKTEKKRGMAIVEGGQGTAARTTGLLGGILSFAVSEGIITSNPVLGVRRPADDRRVRRLDPKEYARLGKALRDAEQLGEAAQGLFGAWLLILTGCRLGEIVHLKWTEVDDAGHCFRLADSKEGASVRPIGTPAFDVLSKIEQHVGCPFVLAPIRSGEVFGAMPRAWKRIAARAELEDVTPHTLRHSFASVAGDLGYSESTIAALLGHAAGSVTSRYVHHLDRVLIAAADNVANEIMKMMSAA